MRIFLCSSQIFIWFISWIRQIISVISPAQQSLSLFTFNFWEKSVLTSSLTWKVIKVWSNMKKEDNRILIFGWTVPLMVINEGLEVIVCVFVCRLYWMSSVFGLSHKIAWGCLRSKINTKRKGVLNFRSCSTRNCTIFPPFT